MNYYSCLTMMVACFVLISKGVSSRKISNLLLSFGDFFVWNICHYLSSVVAVFSSSYSIAHSNMF